MVSKIEHNTFHFHPETVKMICGEPEIHNLLTSDPNIEQWIGPCAIHIRNQNVMDWMPEKYDGSVTNEEIKLAMSEFKSDVDHHILENKSCTHGKSDGVPNFKDKIELIVKRNTCQSSWCHHKRRKIMHDATFQ